MKIHDVEQRSVDWMLLRSGIPTASEFDQLVTPLFKVRDGEMPETFLNRKLAEKWQGGPLAEFNSYDMEQGSVLENEAIPWYELEFGCDVQRVGFITTDDGRAGCSPDGLLANERGLEMKAPRIETHIKYLRSGTLPKEYAAQVHGSMYVTGFEAWCFMSYRRGLPPLLLTIERDEKIQKAIGEAVDSFLDAFDKGWARLCELNGGPPQRKPLSHEKPAAFVSDPNDLIL